MFPAANIAVQDAGPHSGLPTFSAVRFLIGSHFGFFLPIFAQRIEEEGVSISSMPHPRGWQAIAPAPERGVRGQDGRAPRAAAFAIVLGGLMMAAALARQERSPSVSLALGFKSTAWSDQPMHVKPAVAAIQAASLATGAQQVLQDSRRQLATLRLAQVPQRAGGPVQWPKARAPAGNADAARAYFSREIAQRLHRVDAAAQSAKDAAVKTLGLSPQLTWIAKPMTASSHSLSTSPDLVLPSRTTRNGLALDYFHLNSLPAAVAVRFAKREVAGARAPPAPTNPDLRDVDKQAEKALAQGTATVVSRRQKAGILPMPVNQRGWDHTMKRIKEQVGDEAHAKRRNSGDGDIVPQASPVKTKKTAQNVEVASPPQPTKAGVEGRLGKLEAEVARLKKQKSLEDRLHALKVEQAGLQAKYPLLTKAATMPGPPPLAEDGKKAA